MRNLRFFIVLAALSAFSLPCEAAKPRRWIVSSASSFLLGEFNGTSVTSDGRLLVAPALEMVLNTEQPLTHSAVVDKAGTLFVGTGSEGKLFRIPRRGSGEEWADLEEPGVFALAVDSQNRLYAGASPGGKVYRISGKGQAELFFDTETKYLWDMVFDNRDNLYVATGPRGRIFRVNPQGDGQILYDSSEAHIISLARDIEGNLVAGTSPGGQLIRVDAQGKAFVIYDSSMEEMRAVVLDRYGNIYAAGLSFLDSEPAPAGAAKSKTSAKENPKNEEEETITLAGSRKGKRLEVYRVDREGLVETVYSADTELAFDLLVRSDGSVLVGTSRKGRVLAVSPKKMVRLVAQTPDDQATVLAEVEGTLYFCTSNLGKVYRLSATSGERGVYESDALDARLPARWGKIRWALDNPKGSPPRVMTRSGNTSKPDATWSDWSAPLEDPNGSQINSPGARYLQWKVEFSRSGDAGLIPESNAIRRVEVNYLQRNVAPAVEQLTIMPPGAALVKLPVAANPANVALGGPGDAHLYALPDSVRKLGQPLVTPPPQKIFIPGSQSFTWTAKDSNDDDLVYSLFIRLADEREWKLLADNVTNRFFTIDGASFPPGLYQVRVVASDRLSNPPSLAQTGELVSPPFEISSTPPRLETGSPQVSGTSVQLEVRAISDGSSVYQLEYSLEGGPWTLVFPEDGIADSKRETYRITLEGLTSGEQALALRVVDRVGNLGTGRVVLTVP